MELSQALEYIPKVIEKDIVHINYKHVGELADKYYAYYTGVGLDELLQQVTTTETLEEFDQRKLLTKHITKSVLNSTKLPFFKAVRKNPLINKIDFISNAGKREKEIKEFIEKFNGTKNLDQYLENDFIEYNYQDPNAWLIVEFSPNDPTRKAQPYPFVATCKEVIDFAYINGILDYLIVKLPIKYIQNDKQTDGFKWTFYLGNYTIVVQTVSSTENLPGHTYFEIGADRYSEIVYTIQAQQNGSPIDPDLKPAAIRFGFIPDPVTKYNTFLSIFDCAMPYLEKTLKINSELDQSMAMVAFPYRFAYYPNCTHEGCNRGIMPDGKDCPVCKGTGSIPIQSGVQQIMGLPLPRNKDEMIDLNALSASKSPDIELLRFDSEFIQGLKTEVQATIFNQDLITKSQVTTTATEQLLDRDNLNDTLYPFSRKYSEIRSLCVYFIAIYTDNVKRLEDGKPDIIIQHKFPFDFKMKPLNELMNDLKAAYDSKASSATIAAIEDDINEILYFDRPDELKRIRIQNRFNPFRGVSPDEVRLIFASNYASKYDQTLYSNLTNIFAELERENQNPWIYDLEDAKIFDLVDKKVKERMVLLNSEKPKEVERIDFNTQK